MINKTKRYGYRYGGTFIIAATHTKNVLTVILLYFIALLISTRIQIPSETNYRRYRNSNVKKRKKWIKIFSHDWLIVGQIYCWYLVSIFFPPSGWSSFTARASLTSSLACILASPRWPASGHCSGRGQPGTSAPNTPVTPLTPTTSNSQLFSYASFPSAPATILIFLVDCSLSSPICYVQNFLSSTASASVAEPFLVGSGGRNRLRLQV